MGQKITFTNPSKPIVISSPSSKQNCSILPIWQDFFPFLHNSALIKPPSHNNMLPHSEPESTLPSGSSTNPKIKPSLIYRNKKGILPITTSAKNLLNVNNKTNWETHETCSKSISLKLTYLYN